MHMCQVINHTCCFEYLLLYPVLNFHVSSTMFQQLLSCDRLPLNSDRINKKLHYIVLHMVHLRHQGNIKWTYSTTFQ